MIDLHIHTTCSDGQFTPEETMRLEFPVLDRQHSSWG